MFQIGRAATVLMLAKEGVTLQNEPWTISMERVNGKITQIANVNIIS